MDWTKRRPTVSGYFWLRRKAAGICFEQEPRVVKIDEHPDGEPGELWVIEAPGYDDGIRLEDASEHFWWSLEKIPTPSEPGQEAPKRGIVVCIACDQSGCGECRHQSTNDNFCHLFYEMCGQDGDEMPMRLERCLYAERCFDVLREYAPEGKPAGAGSCGCGDGDACSQCG